MEARPPVGAQAASARAEAGEAFRRSAPEGVPPIGCTRVGLHRGEAIVGNFGGEGRMQYTALGDAMNTASRLEGANKAYGSKILFSEFTRRKLTAPALARELDLVQVKGKDFPVAIFEGLGWASDVHWPTPRRLARLTATRSRQP